MHASDEKRAKVRSELNSIRPASRTMLVTLTPSATYGV
jgi:hypothetical protein